MTEGLDELESCCRGVLVESPQELKDVPGALVRCAHCRRLLLFHGGAWGRVPRVGSSSMRAMRSFLMKG